MVAYIVKGEILHSLEGIFCKPIGKVIYLPQQYGGDWKHAWRTTVIDGIQNHLMGAVKDALKEKGGGVVTGGRF
jgi:hypothetical protein